MCIHAHHLAVDQKNSHFVGASIPSSPQGTQKPCTSHNQFLFCCHLFVVHEVTRLFIFNLFVNFNSPRDGGSALVS